ncbi:3-keto-5-aminohexanoate cleavage enzyme [Falsiruegeria litorea R37]|uniref:3-keto-5-aminohexanoate cleavage enzyme n=1 Tax=Falsiruegeria litorea R37 TaxID=1200284 RepID=A0A1Y5T0S8_9RHOB|nr:3-keto-5-aminohexanoate cleavage protein [Falsiruegeria litorea]SLN49415.1 3-keto-5-aminohexanoate cleavage enzyme [Falsiruegeria litorea R37]
MNAPVIMVAPNGARRGKADHPSLPINLNDMLATARACHSAGAGALHLHVRDSEGEHSLDAGRYREALAALSAEVPELDLQITTESAGVYSPHEQLDCLKEVRPKWASISVREINRAPELAEQLYGLCADQETRVQHIAYDASDLHLLHDWRQRGVVRPEQDEVICVLGAYFPPRAGTPDELTPLLPLLDGLSFAVCAFGPQEEACLLAAAQSGANVLRVGFENNLVAPSGTLWRSNADAVSSLKARFERNAA